MDFGEPWSDKHFDYSSERTLRNGLIALFAIWVIKTWIDYRTATTRDGIRQILSPVTLLPNKSDLASMPGFSSSSSLILGRFQLWLNKRGWYDSGWDVCAAVSLFPRVETIYFVADPLVLKKVASSRSSFPKPTEQYSILRIFGMNIVTEEHEEWKKYKRICAPAFNEKNNRLVWDCSISIMSGFFKEIWGSTSAVKEITVDDFKVVCAQLTLRVIGAAGFGQNLSWKHANTSHSLLSFDPTSTGESVVTDRTPSSSGNSSGSHSDLPIEQIFEVISEDLFLKLVLPGWILKNAEWALLPLPKLRNRLIRVREAFDGLDRYLKNLLKDRREGNGDTGTIVRSDDLFSNLIRANEADGSQGNGDSGLNKVWDSETGQYVNFEDEDGITKENDDKLKKLNDTELMGNIFIFLLAGHETSAHTTCFALALLALYQEEQEKLYKHILSVCPDGRLPVYEDLPKLTRIMAVLQETLRLFAPVIGIPKKSAEDTTLVATNRNTGETLRIPVEKGAKIELHTPGIHYNEKYWDNPTHFNPDRFMPKSNWPRDAFVPFSSGTRACIGRRFSEIESIAIITMLVMKYKVQVKEVAQYNGESFEQRKERVLHSRNGITLTGTDLLMYPWSSLQGCDV